MIISVGKSSHHNTFYRRLKKLTITLPSSRLIMTDIDIINTDHKSENEKRHI